MKLRGVGHWSRVLANLPLGLIAGLLALITVAQLTESHAFAFIGGAVAAVVVSTVGGWQAMRAVVADQRMRKLAAVALGLSTFCVAALVAWVMFLSPNPASPAPAGTTGFWDLPTGSQIAYGHAPATGQPLGAPVILLHGGPGSPDGEADAIAAAIAREGFEVFHYHQLGAGSSSRLDDVDGYTVNRHVADLDAIRAAIGADRITIVGASWGSQLAMSYLAAHPTRVERVVVSSPNTIWAPGFADSDRLTPGGADDQTTVIGDNLRFLVPHVLMGIIGPGGAHAIVPDDRADGPFESMVTDLDMWAGCPGRNPGADDVPDAEPRRGFGFWVNAVTTRDSRSIDDPRPALSQVDVQTLVLRGECDYLAWEVTREYREVVPGAVLIPIDDAGHVIWDDQPEVYSDLVGAFLRGEELPIQPYTADAEPWGR